MRRLALVMGMAVLAAPHGTPAGAGEPAAPAVEAPRPVLVEGERFFYRATAWKGPFSGEVGTATLSTTKGTDDAGKPVWRLVARANGSAMGHAMDARAIATLDGETGTPRRYDDTHEGSSAGAHALVWRPTRTVYLKRKHCHGCQDDAHFVTTSRGGFLGIGSESVRVHCDASHCPEQAHRVWQERHVHPADPLAGDALTTLYRARALDLEVGGPARVLRVVVGRSAFDVTVRAIAKESCEVPAGTFDALRIVLEPKPAEGTPASARFEGLFGLCGEITLLVDAERKIPLKIRGTVPMGIDINAEVVCTKIERPAPARAK